MLITSHISSKAELFFRLLVTEVFLFNSINLIIRCRSSRDMGLGTAYYTLNLPLTINSTHSTLHFTSMGFSRFFFYSCKSVQSVFV